MFDFELFTNYRLATNEVLQVRILFVLVEENYQENCTVPPKCIFVRNVKVV